jgi:hypothetical protein
METGMASKAFKSARFDDRTKDIQKDVVTHMFKNYIGKNLPFYIKTMKNNTPTKYDLLEVEYNMYEVGSGSDGGIMTLHFHTNEGPEDDAPFINSKKNIVLEYSLENDDYLGNAKRYHYNAYTVNFLIKAANIIREIYFKSHPVYDRPHYNEPAKINLELTEKNKKTKLNKSWFQMFTYDSNNLLNK